MKKNDAYIFPLMFPGLFFFLGLLACESLVKNVKLSKIDAKLVVTAFISPQDTMISIDIGRSEPIFNPDKTLPLVVNDATVEISDGLLTSQFTYSQKLGYSLLTRDFPIVPGKEYSLKVSTPLGEEVSGNCTIPFAEDNITSLEILTKTTSNGREEKNILLKWMDNPDAQNYYRVFFVRQDFVYLTDTLFTKNESIYSLNLNEAYQDDFNRQGREFSARSDDQVDGLFISGPGIRVESKLLVSLLFTDKNYYLYHKTKENAENNNENPFAEPTQVYTNIQGGLGVFAAYNRIKRELVINQ